MCIVNLDSTGKIESVNTFAGEESILFDKIASNPYISSMEDAVEIYKNVYSDKFLKKNGDWREKASSVNQYDTQEPRLFYQDAFGEITESFATALKNSDGGSVSMGFVTTDDIVETTNGENFFKNDLTYNGKEYKLNNSEAFTPVVTISNTNNDTSTREGFINSAIKSGILSDTTKRVGDTYMLKGAGNLASMIEFNAQLVRGEAIRELGLESVKVNIDGTLTLTEQSTDIELQGKNGSTKMTFDEMQEKLENKEFEALDKKYDGMVGVAYYVFRKTNELFGRPAPSQDPRTDKDLKVILLNTLSKLGISTLSISDYVTKYKQKNGADPDVQALADISNQVIAFAEGQDTVENLTEETAHFVVEGYHDQEAINNVLPQVEGTQEWVQYSELYFNKYGEHYTGDKLVEVVRREILGKILAKAILNRNAQTQQSGLVGSVLGIWDSFVARVRGFFNLSTKQDINDVVNTLASKTVNKDIENYIDINLLRGSEFTLFSLDDRQTLLSLIKGQKQLEGQLAALRSSKDATSATVATQINNLGKAIEDGKEWYAIKVLVSALEPQVRGITRRIQEYKALSADGKNDKTAYLSPAEQHAFKGLTDDFLPLLGEIKAVIKDRTDAPKGVDANRIISQMTVLEGQINDLRGEVAVQSTRDISAIHKRIAEQYGISDAKQALLEAKIEEEFKDIGMLQGMFGSLSHASNPMLGMLGRIININNFKAQTNTLKDINPFLELIAKEGWDIAKFEAILERDEDGNITGFTESPYLWDEFYKAEKEAQVAVFNTVFPEHGGKLTVEQYDQGIKNKTLPRRNDYELEQQNKFDTLMGEWYNENTERRFNQKYYEQKEKLYKDIGVSETTQEFLRNISIRRHHILSKYIEPDVQLDYTRIPASERQQLDHLAQQRKAAKSLVDARTGEFKDPKSTEFKLAEELQRLDEHFKDEQNKKGGKKFTVKNAFYDTLKKMEKTKGPKAAFDWLKANGGLVFSSEFWDSFGDKTSLVDRLNDLEKDIRGESQEDADDLKGITSVLQTLLDKKSAIRNYQP